MGRYQFEIKKEDGKYAVKLPHQCGSWNINEWEIEAVWNGKNWNYQEEYQSKEAVITNLKQFIKEAQEVLEQLSKEKEDL